MRPTAVLHGIILNIPTPTRCPSTQFRELDSAATALSATTNIYMRMIPRTRRRSHIHVHVPQNKYTWQSDVLDVSHMASSMFLLFCVLPDPAPASLARTRMPLSCGRPRYGSTSVAIGGSPSFPSRSKVDSTHTFTCNTDKRKARRNVVRTTARRNKKSRIWDIPTQSADNRITYKGKNVRNVGGSLNLPTKSHPCVGKFIRQSRDDLHKNMLCQTKSLCKAYTIHVSFSAPAHPLIRCQASN